jgi:hypothetical protein
VLIVAAFGAGCAGASSAGDSGHDAGVNSSTDEIAGDVSFDTFGWQTDFTTHSVELSEFISGGPPRDGIPPIDTPRFKSVGEEQIDDREPVISVRVGDMARAYPIQILIWHEIVNDQIGDLKLAVTFCPLCQTSVAFNRVVDGRELTFGTTGNLRKSDLVMWDRQTESWWQQFSGEAIVGEQTGTRLEVIPSQLISFGEFRERFPDGDVLSRETGHERQYGSNPYRGYDSLNERPFLLDEEVDGRLPPKQRVVTLERGKSFVVYPLNRLEEVEVANDEVEDLSVVLWFRPGAASALGTPEIAEGDQVGTGLVYDRKLGGRTLTFTQKGADTLRDEQTGSTWDQNGTATAGPLKGEQLKEVAHDIPFWFAVAAFRPDARIYRP